MYLIAENIDPGHELAVVLHDLGSHLGLEEFLNKPAQRQLMRQVEQWAKLDDGSVEAEAAKAALRRAENSSSANTAPEKVAYMVEELVSRGVAPTLARAGVFGKLTASSWLGVIRQAFLNVLGKLGLTLKAQAFDGQALVDLAYGAAQLRLDKQAGTLSQAAASERMGAQFSEKMGNTATERLDAEAARWSGVVDAYRNKALDRTQTQVLLGSTPASLQALGLPDMEVRIGAHALDYANVRLTEAQMKDLPRQLANPKLAYIHEGQDGPSINFATAFSNANGLVVIALKPNQHVSEAGSAHFVATILNTPGPRVVGEFRKGRGLMVESQDQLPGLRDAIKTAKERGARHSSELRELTTRLSRNYGIPPLPNRLLYKSDLGKLIEQGRAQYSERDLAAPIPNIPERAVGWTGAKVADIFKYQARSLLENKRLQGLNRIMFTHDLAESARRLGMTAVEALSDLFGTRDKIQKSHEQRIAEIMHRADQLKDRTTVEKFLYDSTVQGKWGYVPAWDAKVAVDPGMAARFKALSAEGQRVVTDIFTHGRDTFVKTRDLALRQTMAEYENLIRKASKEDKPKLEHERDKRIKSIEDQLPVSRGPYAPLKRFGDYVVVARSQALLDAMAAENPDQKAIAKMEENPAHYRVEFFESHAQALRRADELKPYFAKSEASVKQKQFGGIDDMPFADMKRIKEAIASLDAPDDKGRRMALERMVNDLYLQMLSESSARKTEMHRRNIAGADTGMLRAFAHQGRAMAHYLAGMEMHGEISNQMTAVRNQAHAATDRNAATNMLNEIAERYAMSLEHRDTPVANALMRITSVWMLLTNPAFYIQNSTQTYMLSMPYMSGRFGMAKTFGALNQAYRDITRAVGKGWWDAIKTGGAGFDIARLNLPDNERAMLETLTSQGKIDITLEADIMRWADGGNGVFDRVMRGLSASVQHVEMLNRITAALTAYRLSGSVKYAGEVVDRTQGNYAASNAPTFFNKSGMHKMALQFRKYQLIQASMIGVLLRDSIKADPTLKTPELQREAMAVARRSFLWLMAQQTLMTGLKGAPLAGLAAIAFAAFGNDGDDDLWRSIRKSVGDDKVTDLLLKGVPGWMGLDVSNKLGMGEALSVTPFAELPHDRKDWGNYVAALGGPVTSGLIPNTLDGVAAMRKGQYYKGLEAMMPSGIRNAMAGWRIANEGQTNARGDVTLSANEVTALDGFMKGIGLPTTALTNLSEKRSDLYKLGDEFTNRDADLKDSYAKAYRENDAARMRDLRTEWMEFQAQKKSWHDEMARRGSDKTALTKLKPQPLSVLIKAPQLQQKREAAYQ